MIYSYLSNDAKKPVLDYHWVFIIYSRLWTMCSSHSQKISIFPFFMINNELNATFQELTIRNEEIKKVYFKNVSRPFVSFQNFSIF